MADIARRSGRFLPYHVVHGWLGLETAGALLGYASQREAEFKPSPIRYGGEVMVNPSLRSSLRLSSLGAFRELIDSRALELKPILEAAFGMPSAPATQLEVELVAHRDGSRFHRHIDTFVALNRQRIPRLLTLVYYLCREPQRFTGGQIRMYALDTEATIDIFPEHDLLVAFPAHAPHSVEPLFCPGGAFVDSRFAVNIWIHG